MKAKRLTISLTGMDRAMPARLGQLKTRQGIVAKPSVVPRQPAKIMGYNGVELQSAL